MYMRTYMYMYITSRKTKHIPKYKFRNMYSYIYPTYSIRNTYSLEALKAKNGGAEAGAALIHQARPATIA